jgi:hypothetical protein
MYSDESTSHSFSTGFQFDSETGHKNLVFSYHNEPKAEFRERSMPHDGTSKLRIIENSKRELDGRYWTDRGSTGDIKLKFKSQELIDEAPTYKAPQGSANSKNRIVE